MTLGSTELLILKTGSHLKDYIRDIGLDGGVRWRFIWAMLEAGGL